MEWLTSTDGESNEVDIGVCVGGGGVHVSVNKCFIA